MKHSVDDFTRALLSLDRLVAKQITEQHISRMSSVQFVEEVVVTALEQIGDGWQKGEYALSQVYMAGRICEDLVDEILPPGDPDRKNQPAMAICVLNDHHKLGKIIVCSILRAAGFELYDYGVVTGLDDLVVQAIKDNVRILLISVLMLPSALKIKTLKEKFDESGYGIKIIVGGAPFRFDDQLWLTVGADAMCRTGSEAISVIDKILGENK